MCCSLPPSLPLGWPLNHYMEILVTALSLEILNPFSWPKGVCVSSLAHLYIHLLYIWYCLFCDWQAPKFSDPWKLLDFWGAEKCSPHDLLTLGLSSSGPVGKVMGSFSLGCRSLKYFQSQALLQSEYFHSLLSSLYEKFILLQVIFDIFPPGELITILLLWLRELTYFCLQWLLH